MADLRTTIAEQAVFLKLHNRTFLNLKGSSDFTWLPSVGLDWVWW